MILTNEYKSNIGRQLTWFIFLVIMTSLFLLAFPIVNDPSVAPIVLNNLDLIPTNISNVIFPYGIEAFSDFEIYFDTILIFIQLIICIFAVNIGLNSLAKEQGFGTIDYLYINPVSRNQILFSKFLGNLLSILVLLILTLIFSTFIYSYISELNFIDVLTTNLIKFAVIFLESILFLSFGTMISAFSKRVSGLTGFATLLIFGLLVLNTIISLEIFDLGIINSLIPLRTLQEIDLNNAVNVLLILFISKIAISILFIIISSVTYNRKDLIV